MALVAIAALNVAACSTTTPTVRGEGFVINDPFEATNRAVFAFNDGVDDMYIHPIVEGYRTAVPRPARTGISNVLNNLKSPMIIINELLQGDMAGAKNAAVRLSVNTFVGVGGIFDVAASEGIPYESEDFGQTLAVWGVGNGPYVVLPFLGPSSLRDYSGYAVDTVVDPVGWYLSTHDKDSLRTIKFAAGYLQLRDSFKDALVDLKATSFDYYAAVRSSYYQTRAVLIRDQAIDVDSAPTIPDYDE